jgi:glyoxylase-like metal-dependent hydrolase (beta-lactamase superfamily II)
MSIKIIPLSEGAFTVDKSKHFIPFNKLQDDLQERNTGSLLVEIQPFALVTSKDIIVIDTGLGFKNADGIMQIQQNLIDKGIQPADVTKVLISHLHKDHAGGITSGDDQLSFPGATYYVGRQELDFALDKKNSSYIQEDFEALLHHSNVELLPEEGAIDEYISFNTSGGHCPFHMTFWIKENNETIFYGGDVAPQLQQMKSRFVAKYDFDGKKSMELRTSWWLQAQQEHWTMLFYHDIKMPYISL